MISHVCFSRLSGVRVLSTGPLSCSIKGFCWLSVVKSFKHSISGCSSLDSQESRLLSTFFVSEFCFSCLSGVTVRSIVHDLGWGFPSWCFSWFSPVSILLCVRPWNYASLVSPELGGFFLSTSFFFFSALCFSLLSGVRINCCFLFSCITGIFLLSFIIFYILDYFFLSLGFYGLVRD